MQICWLASLWGGGVRWDKGSFKWDIEINIEFSIIIDIIIIIIITFIL